MIRGGKDKYINMIMGPVMRSTILLTVVVTLKRTQITSLLLSQSGDLAVLILASRLQFQ